MWRSRGKISAKMATYHDALDEEDIEADIFNAEVDEIFKAVESSSQLSILRCKTSSPFSQSASCPSCSSPTSTLRTSRRRTGRNKAPLTSARSPKAPMYSLPPSFPLVISSLSPLLHCSPLISSRTGSSLRSCSTSTSTRPRTATCPPSSRPTSSTTPSSAPTSSPNAPSLPSGTLPAFLLSPLPLSYLPPFPSPT